MCPKVVSAPTCIDTEVNLKLTYSWLWKFFSLNGSGTTENYPSERQAAAVRSVDGTTQVAKAASLEQGMQAAFVFATADRAAATLKVGPHLATSHVPKHHQPACLQLQI